MMRSGGKPVFFAMYRHVNLQYGLRCRASSGRRSSSFCRLLRNSDHSEVHFFRVVVRVESLCNAQDGILQKENYGCGKPPRAGACPSSNDELIAAHVKSRQVMFALYGALTHASMLERNVTLVAPSVPPVHH